MHYTCVLMLLYTICIQVNISTGVFRRITRSSWFYQRNDGLLQPFTRRVDAGMEAVAWDGGYNYDIDDVAAMAGRAGEGAGGGWHALLSQVLSVGEGAGGGAMRQEGVGQGGGGAGVCE